MYGMTADHVLEMKVILNDGSVAHFAPLETAELAQKLALTVVKATFTARTPAHQRPSQPRNHPQTHRATGGAAVATTWTDWCRRGRSFQWPQDDRFNLAKLICGAEGTLAVITELKLNLVPLPTKTALAIVHFDTLHTALTAVPPSWKLNPPPSNCSTIWA